MGNRLKDLVQELTPYDLEDYIHLAFIAVFASIAIFSAIFWVFWVISKIIGS